MGSVGLARGHSRSLCVAVLRTRVLKTQFSPTKIYEFLARLKLPGEIYQVNEKNPVPIKRRYRISLLKYLFTFREKKNRSYLIVVHRSNQVLSRSHRVAKGSSNSLFENSIGNDRSKTGSQYLRGHRKTRCMFNVERFYVFKK